MTYIEDQIVKQVIAATLAAGFSLSVFDGEEYTIQRSRDADAVFAALHQTDGDVLYCHDGGPSSRWVQFVYGNDGWDVITDYSVFLEDVLRPAEELAARLAESDMVAKLDTAQQVSIAWLTACYTHLIPFNTRNVSGPRLAELIRANYHTGPTGDGPSNETAAAIADSLPGTFHRIGEQRSYTPESP